MKNGSLLEIAEVLKTLPTLQQDKPLSFREKKMLDRAHHMLVTELSTSRGLKEMDAVGLVQKTLSLPDRKLRFGGSLAICDTVFPTREPK